MGRMPLHGFLWSGRQLFEVGLRVLTLLQLITRPVGVASLENTAFSLNLHGNSPTDRFNTVDTFCELHALTAPSCMRLHLHVRSLAEETQQRIVVPIRMIECASCRQSLGIPCARGRPATLPLIVDGTPMSFTVRPTEDVSATASRFCREYSLPPHQVRTIPFCVEISVLRA
jgi:hypothetical protein